MYRSSILLDVARVSGSPTTAIISYTVRHAHKSTHTRLRMAAWVIRANDFTIVTPCMYLYFLLVHLVMLSTRAHGASNEISIYPLPSDSHLNDSGSSNCRLADHALDLTFVLCQISTVKRACIRDTIANAIYLLDSNVRSNWFEYLSELMKDLSSFICILKTFDGDTRLSLIHTSRKRIIRFHLPSYRDEKTSWHSMSSAFNSKIILFRHIES